MNDEEVVKALEEARKSPDRKFSEGVDLVANLKGIDFKVPANKIDLKIVLPSGRGKGLKVAVVGDADFVKKAKNADVRLTDKEIDKSPKEIKKLANDVDYFIAQTTVMVKIGKNWGKYLSTRGKMPQPLPPQADPTPMVERLKKSVTLKSKGKTPNTLHCSLGTKEMSAADLMKNFKAVLNALMEKLPHKDQNIKSLYVKTTMGKPIRIA